MRIVTLLIAIGFFAFVLIFLQRKSVAAHSTTTGTGPSSSGKSTGGIGKFLGNVVKAIIPVS